MIFVYIATNFRIESISGKTFKYLKFLIRIEYSSLPYYKYTSIDVMTIQFNRPWLFKKLQPSFRSVPNFQLTLFKGYVRHTIYSNFKPHSCIHTYTMKTLFLPYYTCYNSRSQCLKMYILLCKSHHLKIGSSVAIFKQTSIMRMMVCGFVSGTDA